ncbi:MAG: NADH-quinone oxidoreductase subunit NuoK [Proteobacteria bacterium]|nr:NADH-quinone oxidoreductase subunit NuoK [Pseudomonadota bacterium]
MVGTTQYLVLGAVLFCIGVAGVFIRRNAIVVFMCIELMLSAVSLTFIALSRSQGSIDGQIFVFFIMTVAAAEAAVGLAIILSLYRRRQTINVDEFDLLKW